MIGNCSNPVQSSPTVQRKPVGKLRKPPPESAEETHSSCGEHGLGAGSPLTLKDKMGIVANLFKKANICLAKAGIRKREKSVCEREKRKRGEKQIDR